MNKIFTTPKEIERNERVLYAGNHYISLPEINDKDAAARSINIVSLSNKGLVEIKGKEALLKPEFYKDGKLLSVENSKVKLEYYYVPCYEFELSGGIGAKLRIYADLREKGLVYEIESTEAVEVKLVCSLDKLSLLRFNSHDLSFVKEVKVDKWLNNPAVNVISPKVGFSMAFGGDREFGYEFTGDNSLILKLVCSHRNAFYITINSDMDGASTTLIHFRRKGFENIYSELSGWLKAKSVGYGKDPVLERILNENLFFNYFFAVGKDMESDRYIALTSRSPRYYVSGAFWERDSFLWSFPAIKAIDREFYIRLCREMILIHAKNAGDHAHYIDGTVLYPGFELDEAASYLILLEDLDDIDDDLMRSLDAVLTRIEKEYDPDTGLYKTFLMPSDDPAEYPLLTIDNVILHRGFKNLLKVYERLALADKADFIRKRMEGIEQGIYKHLVAEVDGKRIFACSGDGKGNHSIYNDPPGNLGLMYYYGFVDSRDQLFKDTIDYYYSAKYKYYFAEAKIRELACDHYPNTPSGLGLCGSILNPLKREDAISWLKASNMDYGLLCESVDRNTGEAKTGVGFATGSGYLAFALYHMMFGGI